MKKNNKVIKYILLLVFALVLYVPNVNANSSCEEYAKENCRSHEGHTEYNACISSSKSYCQSCVSSCQSDCVSKNGNNSTAREECMKSCNTCYDNPSSSSGSSKGGNGTTGSTSTVKGTQGGSTSTVKGTEGGSTGSKTSGCGILGNTGSKTVQLLNWVVKGIRLGIPILIIVMGMIDCLKIVFSGEDKVFKEAFTRFVKRIGIGILLIFIPYILYWLFRLSGMDKQYGIDNFYCGILETTSGTKIPNGNEYQDWPYCIDVAEDFCAGSGPNNTATAYEQCKAGKKAVCNSCMNGCAVNCPLERDNHSEYENCVNSCKRQCK